jgi:hypothetical protein
LNIKFRRFSSEFPEEFLRGRIRPNERTNPPNERPTVVHPGRTHTSSTDKIKRRCTLLITPFTKQSFFFGAFKNRLTKMSFPVPNNEDQRLQLIQDINVLEHYQSDETFQRVVSLAAEYFKVSMSVPPVRAYFLTFFLSVWDHSSVQLHSSLLLVRRAAIF